MKPFCLPLALAAIPFSAASLPALPDVSQRWELQCPCILEVVFLSKMWQETHRKGFGLKQYPRALVAAAWRWKKQCKGKDLPLLPQFPHQHSTGEAAVLRAHSHIPSRAGRLPAEQTRV